MGRPNNRSGFGILRGALNKPIFINNTAPEQPQHKDLWLDTTASPATLKWYDSTTSTWK
jgi:hypothetical protein